MLTVSFIGLGNRGSVYGQYFAKNKKVKMVAACDVVPARVQKFHDEYGVSTENMFYDEETFFKEKRSDVLVIATTDRMHLPHAIKGLEMGYDLLLEKPVAPNAEDTERIIRTAEKYQRNVVICHNLRYTPFYQGIKKLVSEGAIGEVLSVEQAENVAYFHYLTSFVRGNWHNSAESSSIILQKCCHDLDIIYWLVGKKCEKLSSFGGLRHYCKEAAPEGSTPLCVNCKVKNCSYNAVDLYTEYKNGNSIRMFDPDYTAPYNDGASWIPDAVGAYIKESGDYGIVNEVVPYLDGGEGTVLEHVRQGMLYLTTDVGEHGLTLFRRGDWNDSTNGAGNLGRGESVWTSLATVRALKQFAALLEKLGMKELQADMLARAEKMTGNILRDGVYDGHFIHGYDDWGTIVGGGEPSAEASFCLNMQTWAVLADVGDKALQNRVMDMVEEKLKCPYGYRLNTPAYTKPQECVGRTSYFRPGLIENASVYIHGSMFKAVADCMLGRGENAYETVCRVTYRNNPNSGVEPYAVSNMLIGPDSAYREGEAPMSWITGSAGWMYRALTEFILGVRADYDGLRIQPNIPAAWNTFFVERKYRGARYRIEFVRTGKFTIYINGKALEGDLLPIAKAGETLAVRVEF